VQLIRFHDILLLEERLKLAINTTKQLTFYFLILSVVLVITSPYPDWVEVILWVIAIIGITLHAAMVFHKPEKWQSITTIFFFSTLIITSIIALYGSYS